MNNDQQKTIGNLINKYQLKENELLRDYRQSKCDFVRHIISYRLSVFIDIIDDLTTIASQEQNTESDDLSVISQESECEQQLEDFAQYISEHSTPYDGKSPTDYVSEFLSSNCD